QSVQLAAHFALERIVRRSCVAARAICRERTSNGGPIIFWSQKAFCLSPAGLKLKRCVLAVRDVATGVPAGIRSLSAMSRRLGGFYPVRRLNGSRGASPPLGPC